MERFTTIAGLRSRLATERAGGRRVALVPTMGALHAGHLALVRLAATRAEVVVVTVFVNPTQFDRPDDLAAYPRDLAGDEAALAGLGLTTPLVVFAPDATEMYPRPPRTTVSVAGVGDHLCGASRPGHFDGVATVVTKLLHIVGPEVAVFGRKDRQQLQLIRQLCTDLDLPVAVVAGPTVREADGVALSSRNRRLDAEAREVARALPLALRAAALAARDARATGRPWRVGELRAAAAAELTHPGLRLDYLEVVDPDTMAPLADEAAGEHAVVAVAAHLGEVRLIDNVEVGDHADEDALLAATGG